MKIGKKWLTGMLAAAQLVCPFVNGLEMVVMASDGESTILDVPTLLTLEDLNQHLNSTEGGAWTFMAAQHESSVGPRAGYSLSDDNSHYAYDLNAGARDYYYTPTADDKNNIAYVVKTLADKSEISLLLYANSVETAGNKVAHVHPLKFLQTIFSDEELKVGMRNIRKKSLVWKKFRSGIADSLADEHGLDNMKDAYLVEFCNALTLNLNQVIGFYQQAQWKEFIDAVVIHVPRKGDYRRYDMSTR